MNFKRSIIFLFVLICIFSFLKLNAFSSPVLLSAHAGNNTGVCPGDSVKLGGNPSATGGIPPYNYSWQPAASLSSANIPNPYAHSTSPTNYTLTVTDGGGNTSVSVVSVSIYSLPMVSAGPDQTILSGHATQLSASGATNYYWTPTGTLTNQNTATPTAEPTDRSEERRVG